MPQHATAATENTPYWADSATFPTFTPIDRDEHVDVLVVGGGITGLTAAYLLTAAGKTVALLERGRCVQVDTGHTTAHVTMVTDTSLTDLASRFGRPHAQAVWERHVGCHDRLGQDPRAEESLGGDLRPGAYRDPSWCVGLRQEERRLPLLPHS